MKRGLVITLSAFVLASLAVNFYLLRRAYRIQSSLSVRASSEVPLKSLLSTSRIETDKGLESKSSSEANNGDRGIENDALNSKDLEHQVNNTSSVSQIIPVAYAPSLDNRSLTQDEINGIDAVAKEFQQKVGPPPSWSGDPAYVSRWEAARNAADDRLRGVLGNDAYNAHAEALLKGMTNVSFGNATGSSN